MYKWVIGCSANSRSVAFGSGHKPKECDGDWLKNTVDGVTATSAIDAAGRAQRRNSCLARIIRQCGLDTKNTGAISIGAELVFFLNYISILLFFLCLPLSNNGL